MTFQIQYSLVHPTEAYLSDNLLLGKGFQASAQARQKGLTENLFRVFRKCLKNYHLRSRYAKTG
jgi:hypothetical protein